MADAPTGYYQTIYTPTAAGLIESHGSTLPSNIQSGSQAAADWFNYMTVVPGSGPGAAGWNPPGAAGAGDGGGGSSGAVGGGAAAGTSGDIGSASAIIRQYLHDWGLDSLADFANTALKQGMSSTEVGLLLQQQPAYRQRFAANDERVKRGLAPLSPAEYLAHELITDQQLRAAGLSDFYDAHTLAQQNIAGDVSPAEQQDRINLARDATYTAAPEDLAQLQSLYGIGAGSGHLIAHYLDPAAALPVIQRQFRAGQLSGAAVRGGFGGLTAAEAEGLAGRGVSVDQAQAGFGDLYQQRELVGALPGQAGEQPLSRQQELGAEFGGDALAQDAFRQRAARRKAEFGGGGGFATSRGGFAGL